MTLLPQRTVARQVAAQLQEGDDDPFLDYVVPAPARYLNDPRTFAKKVLALVLRTAGSPAGHPAAIRLLPRFSAGCSITAPASR